VATLSSSSATAGNEGSASSSSRHGSCVARATAALSLLGSSGCGGVAGGTVAVDRCLRLGGRCCVASELPPPPKDQTPKLHHNLGVGSTGVVVELKPWLGEAAVMFDHVTIGSDASGSAKRIVRGVPLHCLNPAGPSSHDSDDEDASRASTSSSSHGDGVAESATNAGGSNSTGWKGNGNSIANLGSVGGEVDSVSSLVTVPGSKGGDLGTNAAIGSDLMRRAPSALDALASAVMLLSASAQQGANHHQHEQHQGSGSASSSDQDGGEGTNEDATTDCDNETSSAGLLISALAADALAVLATAVSSPSLTANASSTSPLSSPATTASNPTANAAAAAAAALPLSVLPLTALARAAAQPCVPDGLSNGSAKSRACVAVELSQRLYEATTTSPPLHALALGNDDDHDDDEVNESKSSNQPPPLQRSHEPQTIENVKSAQSTNTSRRSSRSKRTAKESHAMLWVGHSSYEAALADEGIRGSNSAVNNKKIDSSSKNALLPEGHASTVGVWACGPLFTAAKAISSASAADLATADNSRVSGGSPAFSSQLAEALGQPGLNLRFDPTNVSDAFANLSAPYSMAVLSDKRQTSLYQSTLAVY